MPAQDHQQPGDADVGSVGSASAADETLTAQLAEMRDRWVRSEAETANVRARARREVDDARNYGITKFAGDMVEAAENLKRGLDSLPAATSAEPKSLSGLRSGLVEIERGFIDVLHRNGVTREDPTGAVFSPVLHQAIGQREVANQPAGTVAQAVSSVWTLNGRLLRPAIVLVATAPAEPKSPDAQA